MCNQSADVTCVTPGLTNKSIRPRESEAVSTHRGVNTRLKEIKWWRLEHCFCWTTDQTVSIVTIHTMQMLQTVNIRLLIRDHFSPKISLCLILHVLKDKYVSKKGGVSKSSTVRNERKYGCKMFMYIKMTVMWVCSKKSFFYPLQREMLVRQRVRAPRDFKNWDVK